MSISFKNTKELASKQDKTWSVPVSIEHYHTDKRVCTPCLKRRYLKLATVDSPDITEVQRIRNTRQSVTLTRLFRQVPTRHNDFQRKPLGKQRISNIIFTCMENVCVDRSLFTAGSCRGAARSKAYAAGISEKRILDQGRWTSAKTWRTFYARFHGRPIQPAKTADYCNAKALRQSF